MTEDNAKPPKPPKVAFRALLEMGEHHVRELDDRLKRGVSASAIAAAIQDEWKFFPGVSRASLMRQLARYRKRRIQPEVRRELDSYLERSGQKHLMAKFDAIMELTLVAQDQKARLDKMRAKEAGSPLLLGMVSNEIDRLSRTLIELAKLQLEVGILKRVPRPVAIGVAHFNGHDEPEAADPDPNLIAFRWTPEDQRESEEIDAEFERIYGRKPGEGRDKLEHGEQKPLPPPDKRN